MNQLLDQILFWGAVAAVIALLTQWPQFSPLPEAHGELKLSVAHLSDRLEPCRQLTPEEILALPPNMRTTEVCERERAPVVVLLEANGETLMHASVNPAGLHRGGRTYVHEVWALPEGRYALDLRLRDTPREQGYDRHYSFTLDLAAGDSALLKVGDGDAALVNRLRGETEND